MGRNLYYNFRYHFLLVFPHNQTTDHHHHHHHLLLLLPLFLPLHHHHHHYHHHYHNCKLLLRSCYFTFLFYTVNAFVVGYIP